MMDKKKAETDILQFIEDAFRTVGAFNNDSIKDEEQHIDTLMDYLKNTDMTEDQWMEAEPLVSELVRVSGVAGFKRGFGIATRIIMAGMNIGGVLDK